VVTDADDDDDNTVQPLWRHIANDNDDDDSGKPEQRSVKTARTETRT